MVRALSTLLKDVINTHTMKKIPLTKSHRLEESVWHINEAHKQASPYFQLCTLTIKILMGTPNRVESTRRTISNALVKRHESIDYPYKQILWTLSRVIDSESRQGSRRSRISYFSYRRATKKHWHSTWKYQVGKSKFIIFK